MKVTLEMIRMLQTNMYSRLKTGSDIDALYVLIQAINEYNSEKESVLRQVEYERGIAEERAAAKALEVTDAAAQSAFEAKIQPFSNLVNDDLASLQRKLEDG